MLSHLRLSTRISLIGIATTLCFASALPWIHSKTRELYYSATRERIQKLVQETWSVVDFYGAQAKAGLMTTEQAQAAAKLAVKHIRYGTIEGEYFWINDLHPRMVMNPLNPALDGKDLTESKDPNGVHVPGDGESLPGKRRGRNRVHVDTHGCYSRGPENQLRQVI